MKLLDAATVSTDNSIYGGVNLSSRSCNTYLQQVDPCVAAAPVPIVGDPDSAPSWYTVLPFALVGRLNVPVRCAKDDDEEWLRKAMQAAQEYALSHALVVQPVSGTEGWVGDDNVQEVPATGDLAADAAAARKLWFQTVMTEEGRPIMHVAPEAAPGLVSAGVLHVTDTTAQGVEVSSVWGDPVVIAAGYDQDSPQVFFTGEINIYLSSVDSDGVLVDQRANLTSVIGNMIAMIDVNPCSIVRVGAANPPVLLAASDSETGSLALL